MAAIEWHAEALPCRQLHVEATATRPGDFAWTLTAPGTDGTTTTVEVAGRADAWDGPPDCDDADPTVGPGRPDVRGDNKDNDCDDTNPAVPPGAPEIDDGIDATATERSLESTRSPRSPRAPRTGGSPNRAP